MINLVIGENIVTLTLNENIVYDSNSFLFVFYSNETRQSINFLALDQSTTEQEQRFNKFFIELVADISQQDPENAKIFLPNKGFYEYKVYNQEQPNLIIQESDVIVEYGRVYYEFSEASITSFNPDIEIIVYNGE